MADAELSPRDVELLTMKKTADLRAECRRLDAEIEALKVETSAIPADSFDGLKPMSLYVSGASWNGTEVRVIRCAPRGPDAEKWMVIKGGKMLASNGQWLGSARPFHQVRKNLQALVAFDLSDAIEHARKA